MTSSMIVVFLCIVVSILCFKLSQVVDKQEALEKRIKAQEGVGDA